MAISVHGAGGDGSNELEGPFEDAEARAFYEELPDLKAVLPAVLFGDDASSGADEPTSIKAELAALLKQLPQVVSKHETDEVRSPHACSTHPASHAYTHPLRPPPLTAFLPSH